MFCLFTANIEKCKQMKEVPVNEQLITPIQIKSTLREANKNSLSD